MTTIALSSHKGFTLIELLAVMAIVAVLAGIVSVSTAGSGQASRDTQTKQDATSVETSVASFFGSQLGTETSDQKVVEVLNQKNLKQVISNKWPEKFISAAYPEVFPEGAQSKVGSIFFLDDEGELSDLRVRGLLQRFNAVDFDVLSDGGSLTTVPKNASETSKGFANYLWLLEKTTASSSSAEVSSRNVAVFKLDSIITFGESELVDLIYRRLFGGIFVDAIPVASDQTVVTDEDTPTDIILAGTDLDTCELIFTIEEYPSHGDLSPITDLACVPGEPNTDSAIVTYVPNLNFNGEDSFTYSVIDGNGDDLGTTTVTINVVNDPPTVNEPLVLGDFSVDEDLPGGTSFDVSSAFDDVDIFTNSDILTYLVSANSNPSLVAAFISGSNIVLHYLQDQNGSANITVRATDLANATAEDSFIVTVDPVNDNPIVTATPLTDVDAFEDDPDKSIDVSTAFTDVDIATNGDSLSFSVVSSNPSLVAAFISGSSLVLDYLPDQNGSALITVRATDNPKAYVEDSFTVTVTAVNDPPSFGTVLSKTVLEDSDLQTVTGWASGIS